jgi:hypothetical protein
VLWRRAVGLRMITEQDRSRVLDALDVALGRWLATIISPFPVRRGTGNGRKIRLSEGKLQGPLHSRTGLRATELSEF